MNKLTQWALNITAFIFFFVLFVVIFFPLESVIRNYALPQIEKTTQGAYRVDFKDLSASLIFGSVFSDLSLLHREKDGDQIWIKLGEVNVKLNYLALLTGSYSVDFKGQGSKGGVSGNLNINNEFNEVTIHFEDFGLGSMTVLKEKMPLPLTGQIDGDVDFKVENKKNGKMTGSVDIKLKNFQMDEGSIPVQNFTYPLPAIKLSDAKGGSFKMTLSDKKWELDELKMTGGDLEIDLKGRIQKSRLLIQSRPTINGTIKISADLLKVLPLKMAGIEVGPDGSLAFSLTGTFDGPRLKIANKEFVFGRAVKTNNPPKEQPKDPAKEPAKEPEAPLIPVDPKAPDSDEVP